MNKKTFAEQMAYLSAAYEREVSTEIAGVYWHQLGSLPDAPFVDAVVQHVANCDRFPRISQLRALTQAAIRTHGPKALPAPVVSTEAVLRDHARILGVDEDKYIAEVLNRE